MFSFILLQELPKDKWFCCDDCNRIFETLQNLVFKEAEPVPAPLSDPIIRKHADRGIFIDGVTDDVQWRVFSGKSRCPEHLPFLSSAAAIFRVSIWDSMLYFALIVSNSLSNIQSTLNRCLVMVHRPGTFFFFFFSNCLLQFPKRDHLCANLVVDVSEQ